MSGTGSEAGAQVPAPEELARANIYGLIARLFYAAPDQQLLGELLHAPEAPDAPGAQTARGKQCAQAWRAIVDAAGSAFPVQLENEHTELFAAPGKTPVTPYLMHYVMRYESETPLVALRSQLSDWGLARREGVAEPEDHVSAMCEVMRFAIAVQHRLLEEQKAFFEGFFYAGATGFCNAVTASPNAHFYRHVAQFAHAFFELEHEAFANL